MPVLATRIRRNWRILGQEYLLGERPWIMGIVNVTPDSFSDGGQFLDPEQAIAHARRLVAEGAEIVDIGGESTRPGAKPVSEEEEWRRVGPVIEALVSDSGQPGVLVSIDTTKPFVARKAISAGAAIVNDVTGFQDPRMVDVLLGSEAAAVVMHMRGTPQTMDGLTRYEDVVAEVGAYLSQQVAALEVAGVSRDRIAVDPGIGFAKGRRDSRRLIRDLDQLHPIGCPVLLGASRKRMVAELVGEAPEDRLSGTLATSVLAALRGVHILRVHDVRATRAALALTAAIETDPSR